MEIVAFIFARGGSKEIKNKNLLKFKNTTLLGHAINQAKKIKKVSQVFVSTDSKKIFKYAKKYKAQSPFLRPKKFSKDNSPEIDAWRHAIKFLKTKLNLNPKYILSVPTTCPLREISDLNKCLSKAIKNKLDLVFTATKSNRSPYFNMVIRKGKKIRLVSEIFNYKNKKIIFRRQDAPQSYDLTTACYVFKPNYILKNDNLFSGNVDFVEIPKQRAIDIDNNFDYKLVNFLSKK